MKRTERENMITFIQKVKHVSAEQMMRMSDEDVDHLYTRAYETYEMYEELV
ncbi:BH0509 family protein [Bacillus daqingensis]|uniref:BH0509 family protein n=1 Tax=Bacillus daqingensis TaxID=872396 RepID=A0ABV9NTA7_9BACI